MASTSPGSLRRPTSAWNRDILAGLGQGSRAHRGPQWLDKGEDGRHAANPSGARGGFVHRPEIRVQRPTKGQILRGTAPPTVGTISRGVPFLWSKRGKRWPGLPGYFGPGTRQSAARLRSALRRLQLRSSRTSSAEPTRGHSAATASPARRRTTTQSAALARPRLPCSPLCAANHLGGSQWAAGPGVR